MKKFRVLSDLHLDINEKFPFDIKDKDIFTVIAGDTYGERYSISFKCSNDRVGVKVIDSEKFSNYCGTRTKIVVKYNSRSDVWTNNGNIFSLDNSGVLISKNGVKDSNGPSFFDGDKIQFKINRLKDWIPNNIKNGIVIAGNHLVYNHDGLSIEALKRRLHEEYPISSSISFLDNSVGVMQKEVDGILFVGSTLYTNYELRIDDRYEDVNKMSTESLVELNMRYATPKMSGGGLNDFNFAKTEECTYNKSYALEADDDLSYLTPKNYLNFFNRTFSEIKKIVSNNKDKDIVIITHHCPSPKCISKEYVSDCMNASYVSDLEKFIIENPNIKCWVCGHVHHRDSFKIGNCLIVMNPLGYCRHGQFRKTKESKYDWTPDFYVNTDTWEVEKEPFDNALWVKKYDKIIQRQMAYYRKFGGFFC